MKIPASAVLLLAVCSGLFSAPAEPQIKISGLLDWEKNEISAVMDLNLSSVNIRFPAGRSQAEEILNDEYIGRMKPLLLKIQADSS